MENDHIAGTCKAVIEHGVEIINLKEEQTDVWTAIRAMGKTANNIYVAVLASLLTLLANILLSLFR